mmetsp:Transcript_5680/g.11824  ORF Transcript_5680/g.11824 Transcript_5680/m.11824 type:complete len:94 (-) Transcript_5680:2398-2679(-)
MSKSHEPSFSDDGRDSRGAESGNTGGQSNSFLSSQQIILMKDLFLGMLWSYRSLLRITFPISVQKKLSALLHSRNVAVSWHSRMRLQVNLSLL